MDIGERKAEINSKQKLNKIISEDDKCYDRNKQDDMKILREQAVMSYIWGKYILLMCLHIVMDWMPVPPTPTTNSYVEV